MPASPYARTSAVWNMPGFRRRREKENKKKSKGWGESRRRLVGAAEVKKKLRRAKEVVGFSTTDTNGVEARLREEWTQTSDIIAVRAFLRNVPCL